MIPKKLTPDEQLADDISRFYADPLGFVMYAYPWTTDKAIQQVKLAEPWKSKYNAEFGPDKWACEFLDDLGAQVKLRGFDGVTAVAPIRYATASGHGIGKSVMVTWLIEWIMCTRPLCHGTVTAMTDVQLRTKTWATLGAWHKRSICEHWFNYTSGRGAMALKHKQFPEDWFCTAQTSKEENSESFAGQHAANSTSFYIFDEASGISDKIYEVRDGGVTDGEPMIFDFGNPTRKSGQFFEECVGKLKHRYTHRQIDSRTVAITNKEETAQMIEDFGLDSDRVKVRVLGQFPSAGSMQFIPTDIVEMAMAREIAYDRNAPLIIGVDVARFGDDDSVIVTRFGSDARSWPARRFSGLDTVALVGKVIEVVREFRAMQREPAMIFVDGGGVGGGVVDQLRALGYNVTEINFGGSPTDKATYRYKADEMWGRMKKAIADRLCLPDRTDQNSGPLKDQLTQREFDYTLKQQINLESKKDMKERGISSPDIADALALTYAEEVNAVAQPGTGHNGGPQMTNCEYDPLEAKW